MSYSPRYLHCLCPSKPVGMLYPDPDPLLCFPCAACRLGISPETLRQYRSQGRIESVTVGRNVRFPTSVIDRIRREGVRPARSTFNAGRHASV